MRVALIILAELINDGEGAVVPRGLLSFGPRTIARRQLDLALSLGCERIVCLGQTLSAGIIDLQRTSERQKAQFHFVRGPRNVSALIRAGDEVLVQADGLLADPEEARSLLSGGSSVLVMPVEAGVALGFERIDLNRAWAGAMLIPGTLAERLFDLPEDADTAAALLRIALQARVPERELPDQLVPDKWMIVRSAQDAFARETAWIRRVALSADAFSPTSWLAGHAVAWRGLALVHGGVGPKVPVAASVLLVIAALLAAGYWSAIAGLLLFACATVSLETASVLHRLEGGTTRTAGLTFRRLSWLYDIPLAVLLAFAVGGATEWQSRIFAPLVVLGLTRLVPSLSSNRWARPVEDRGLFSLAAVVVIAIGPVLPVLRAYSLTLLAFALVATRLLKR